MRACQKIKLKHSEQLSLILMTFAELLRDMA
jgi:hypothetical protein